jgi:hypothetical protein
MFVCCCCSWQVQSSWLMHTCLDSIGLACMHASTALDICVSDASQKKARQDTLGTEFPSEHFGNRVLHHAGISEVWYQEQKKCSDWNTFPKVFPRLNFFMQKRENRQNLHVFNLWPVIYHTKKNSCWNPTLETLSVKIYTSQQDYPKSTCFYFVAIDVSQQKTVPVYIYSWKKSK